MTSRTIHKMRTFIGVMTTTLLLSACSHNGIYRGNYSDECTFKKKGDCAGNALPALSIVVTAGPCWAFILVGVAILWRSLL